MMNLSEKRFSRGKAAGAVLVFLFFLLSITMLMGCGKKEGEAPTPTEVPRLAGLSPQEAASMLEGVGLLLEGSRQEYSESVEEGKVISSIPPEGSQVEGGTPVTLVISLGPQAVEMPDLRSLPSQEAAALLVGLGLTCQTQTSPSESVAAGLVLSQDPPPGSRVSRGTPVTLTVSSGSAWRTCPSCGGTGRVSVSRTCPECGGSGQCFT